MRFIRNAIEEVLLKLMMLAAVTSSPPNPDGIVILVYWLDATQKAVERHYNIDDAFLQFLIWPTLQEDGMRPHINCQKTTGVSLFHSTMCHLAAPQFFISMRSLICLCNSRRPRESDDSRHDYTTSKAVCRKAQRP